MEYKRVYRKSSFEVPAQRQVVSQKKGLGIDPFPGTNQLGSVWLNTSKSGAQNSSVRITLIKRDGSELTGILVLINQNGTQYTQMLASVSSSVIWDIVFTGSIQPSWPDLYGNSQQDLVLGTSTSLGNAVQAYCGNLVARPYNTYWELLDVWRMPATPSNWSCKFAIDFRVTPNRPSGALKMYVYTNYITGQTGSTFSLLVKRQNGQGTSTIQIIQLLPVQTNILLIDNTLDWLYGYTYIGTIQENTTSGTTIFPYADFNLHMTMGATIIASSLAGGAMGTTFPITQTPVGLNSCQLTIKATTVDAIDNIDVQNQATTNERVKFKLVAVKNSWDLQFTQFALSLKIDKNNKYEHLCIAQFIDNDIILKTNGSLQSSEWFNPNYYQNNEFAYASITEIRPQGYIISEWFSIIDQPINLLAAVNLAKATPGVYVNTNMSIVTLNTRRSLYSASTLSFQLYAFYESVPIPPTPGISQGYQTLQQEKAVEEGEEVVDSIGRNLNSKQYSRKYFKPGDIEDAERLKQEASVFLKKSDNINTWKDASPQEFFAAVNSQNHLRTKLDFPHLTNKETQDYIMEIYPDRKKVLDLFGKPDIDRRQPFWNTLEDDEKLYQRNSVWNVPKMILGLLKPRPDISSAQYQIQSFPDNPELWNEQATNYYYFGVPYNVHNKTQAYMIQDILNPYDDEVYDPSKFGYKTPLGVGEKITNLIFGEVEDINPGLAMAVDVLQSSEPIREAAKQLQIDKQTLSSALAPLVSTIPGTQSFIISRALQRATSASANELAKLFIGMTNEGIRQIIGVFEKKIELAKYQPKEILNTEDPEVRKSLHLYEKQTKRRVPKELKKGVVPASFDFEKDRTVLKTQLKGAEKIIHAFESSPTLFPSVLYKGLDTLSDPTESLQARRKALEEAEQYFQGFRNLQTEIIEKSMQQSNANVLPIPDISERVDSLDPMGPPEASYAYNAMQKASKILESAWGTISESFQPIVERGKEIGSVALAYFISTALDTRNVKMVASSLSYAAQEIGKALMEQYHKRYGSFTPDVRNSTSNQTQLIKAVDKVIQKVMQQNNQSIRINRTDLAWNQSTIIDFLKTYRSNVIASTDANFTNATNSTNATVDQIPQRTEPPVEIKTPPSWKTKKQAPKGKQRTLAEQSLDFAKSYIDKNGIPTYSEVKQGLNFAKTFGLFSEYTPYADVVVDTIDTGISVKDAIKDRTAAVQQWVENNPYTAGGAMVTAAAAGSALAYLYVSKSEEAAAYGMQEPESFVIINNPDITETSQGRAEFLVKQGQVIDEIERRNPPSTEEKDAFVRGLSEKFSDFMMLTKFKKNIHGYVLFKVLKSIINPEDHIEFELQQVVNQYFFRRKIYSSKDVDDPGHGPKHKYDQFVEIVHNHQKLDDLVERITHQQIKTHRQSFSGAFYRNGTGRPNYELIQPLKLRPLPEVSYQKRRDQKKK